MSFKDPVQPLKDILASVGEIGAFTGGLDFPAFRADIKTIRAVERGLQIISEAAVRLGPQAETLCPRLPWREIRGLGNWLRHGYDRLDLERIFHTATVDLVPLKTSVEDALERLQGPTASL